MPYIKISGDFNDVWEAETDRPKPTKPLSAMLFFGTIYGVYIAVV